MCFSFDFSFNLHSWQLPGTSFISTTSMASSKIVQYIARHWGAVSVTRQQSLQRIGSVYLFVLNVKCEDVTDPSLTIQTRVFFYVRRIMNQSINLDLPTLSAIFLTPTLHLAQFMSSYSWVACDVTKKIKYKTKEPFKFLS